MRGQRHLIKCRCVLQQFKGRVDPPAHHFMTFSVIDDSDNPVVKYAQCNNCGIIHKVVDICTSEVLQGKEAMSSIVTIEDIKQSLPSNLSSILERHNVDISTWELAQFYLENKQWGNVVVMTQEEDSGSKHGKYVRILSETFFKIENFNREEYLTP